jgi:NAD(P)-dependent dehydrogenase (short-subunit alcohol dehydrogenase family)
MSIYGELFTASKHLQRRYWGMVLGPLLSTPVQSKESPVRRVTLHNMSKAAIKSYTESLAHELRKASGKRVTAHLLIPGYTFTGMTGAQHRPAAAWTPEQVVEFMLAGITAGDFYILCPDYAVDRVTDELRIRWAAEDIIENRPALSRWHPDFEAAFAQYMMQGKEP